MMDFRPLWDRFWAGLLSVWVGLAFYPAGWLASQCFSAGQLSGWLASLLVIWPTSGHQAVHLKRRAAIAFDHNEARPESPGQVDHAEHGR